MPNNARSRARHLYAAENLFVGQNVVNLDTVANTWMRAPGESIGTFALGIGHRRAGATS